MQKHIDAVHEDKRPCLCSYCGKGCKDKAQLKVHVTEVHEGIKPHMCTICGHSFSRQNRLRQGLLYKWTEHSADLFFEIISGKKAPQITLREWIFWSMIFYDLKKFISRSSNEGSNFIMSSLEVGH